jgi:hypothetical protein
MQLSRSSITHFFLGFEDLSDLHEAVHIFEVAFEMIQGENQSLRGLLEL